MSGYYFRGEENGSEILIPAVQENGGIDVYRRARILKRQLRQLVRFAAFTDPVFQFVPLPRRLAGVRTAPGAATAGGSGERGATPSTVAWPQFHSHPRCQGNDDPAPAARRGHAEGGGDWGPGRCQCHNHKFIVADVLGHARRRPPARTSRASACTGRQVRPNTFGMSSRTHPWAGP